MAAIRGGDTKPELQIRRALHAAGLRYRLHAKELPGKPDLLLPRHRAALFIHGCFWHRHDCHLFKWPATREGFWREKIGRNVENDERAIRQLREAGWRTGIVWECALKGRTRPGFAEVVQRLIDWIRSEEPQVVISGK